MEDEDAPTSVPKPETIIEGDGWQLVVYDDGVVAIPKDKDCEDVVIKED